MLFPEKCFNFGEKYHIIPIQYSEIFFSYLGKNVLYPEKFFDSQNGTLGGGGRSPKIFFKRPFFFLEKCPSKHAPTNFSKLPTPLVYTNSTPDRRILRGIIHEEINVLNEVSSPHTQNSPDLDNFVSSIFSITITSF